MEKPELHIVINPDGTNNFPVTHGNGKWPEQMIDLAVGHYEVSDGVVELDARTAPVNLLGEGLRLLSMYDPRTPSYLVDLKSRGLRVIPGGLAPLELGFSSQFTLEKSRFVISNLHLSTSFWHADLQGTLDNPMPRAAC